MVDRGSARRAAERLDAWIDGGWWAAEVLADAAEAGHVIVKDAMGNTRSAPLEDLRSPLLWQNGRWSVVRRVFRTKGALRLGILTAPQPVVLHSQPICLHRQLLPIRGTALHSQYQVRLWWRYI